MSTVGTLSVPKGINAIPINTIPTVWDRTWFASFIKTWLAPSDIRNAIPGPGITISGTAVTPATIDVSDSIKELLSQPYLMANNTVSMDLTKWRFLEVEPGVLTAVDAGPEEPLTVGVASNGIGNTKLAEMPSNTLKGNNAGIASDALDLPVLEVLEMLDIPAGTDSEIQYNSAGALSADPSFSFVVTTQVLSIGTAALAPTIQASVAASATSSGINLTVRASSSGATSGSGGTLALLAGSSASAGSGGNVAVTPGLSATQATDGMVLFQTARGITNLMLDPFLNVVTFAGTATAADVDGFLYIPKVAGAPSGTPAHLSGSYASAVPMRYDTTDNKLYVYNGAWKSVTLT